MMLQITKLAESEKAPQIASTICKWLTVTAVCAVSLLTVRSVINAHRAHVKIKSAADLKRIGKTLELTKSHAQSAPALLASMFNAHPDIDPKSFVINPVLNDSTNNAVIACDAAGKFSDGGNLLFRDIHVKYIKISEPQYREWAEAFAAGDSQAAIKGPGKWSKDDNTTNF